MCSRDDYRDADEIIITGGEPTIYWTELQDLIHDIRTFSSAKIILYTARIDAGKLRWLADAVDGLTVTLHGARDLLSFACLVSDGYLWPADKIRVKVGRDIVGMEWVYVSLAMNGWNVEWFTMLDDCPVPADEILMKKGPK